jgi:pimeloyl-ACP methyl ester carboxylesterase
MATPTYTLNSTNDRFSIPKLIGFGVRALDRFSPRRADSLLMKLFLTPRRIARPKRELAWLETAARFDHVMTDGHRVALWIWGESLRGTVLLVHGWEGRGSQMGAFAEPLAAAGYRVIAVDLPAHGDSAGTMTNVVEASRIVDDLSRRFAPFRAIVAHSFGCAATVAAIARGLATGRLVFIYPANDYTHFGDFFSATLGLPEGTPDRIRRAVERHVGATWQELQPDFVARSTDIPALVIHDEHDREIPIEQGEKVAHVWPDGELMTTRRLGHRRILRDEKVVEAVVAWVAPASETLALAM